MKNLWLLGLGTSLLMAACNNSSDNKSPDATEKTTSASKTTNDSAVATAPANRKMASAEEIMARKQVPVLCYHHIYDIPKATREYDVTVNQFKEQMKMLADSGYKTISGEQLYNYLAYGDPIPEKPVMITFDDTDLEQFTVAKPELDKYGFKGVYFLMTISIGRPRYMTKEMIKQLADEGHTIGSHTWDHSRFDKYKYENEKEIRGKKQIVNDYDLQLADTKKKIEEITGKPIHDFAFPFGVWNAAGLPELEKRGYRLAYQLSTKRDSTKPLMTVRRIIVPPQWSTEGLLRTMRSSFR